jgi:hypothetical protein
VVSKYSTIKESQQRVGSLLERIGRLEKAYADAPNYITWESLKYDKMELRVLNRHIEKLEDETKGIKQAS